MFKVLELLKPLTEEWGSDPNLQQFQGSERGSGRQDDLLTAAKDLQQAWGLSLCCQLQLQTRLEILLDWAVGLQQDGGAIGEMPLLDSDVRVPALLGMEYPDSMGSGLSVPVLGGHNDPVTGVMIPLAGTMEDPDGKGLVAIRHGSQTVDPVTGMLAAVVGARLDTSKKTVIPVTASYWLTMLDQTDSVQVEALQREVCTRKTYWQQQTQREEDILSDLDSALFQCLFKATEANSYQVPWSGRQLKEAAMELQESAQTEAQRRAAQHSNLALILPPHVLHILSLGDEEEWDQQRVLHSELISGLEKMDVCMEQLLQEQEKWATQGQDQASALYAMDKEMKQRELWEQLCSIQAELEAAVNVQHCARHLSQLRADTAQAVLCGSFLYRDYSLFQCRVHRHPVKVMTLLQHKALPLLERLNQILEDKQPASFSPNICNQHVSAEVKLSDIGFSRPFHPETTGSFSGFWDIHSTTRGSGQPYYQPGQYPMLTRYIHPLFRTKESHKTKESTQPTQISLPSIPEDEWIRLLELSPLFQLLKQVEQQLKSWACGTKLSRGELPDRGQSFVDVLEAQWECEGELIPLDVSVLNPREFLVYQHGLFLMHMLCNLKLTRTVSLQIAASLPNNNYSSNTFRNSFFYQEAEETLFVRRQRLQSVGGFSLLLLHCLSHIKVNDMSSDSSPHFQRLFYKTLQACLAELFQARLGVQLSGQEDHLASSDLKGPLSDSHAASLLYRLHKPSRGALSEDKVEELQQKYRETSLFSHLEKHLKDQNSETTERCED
ncbi:uncharacterized protein si:dkey-103g5.4 [Cheilinus undulatus]|uniref:uncharacterized protein si:dkey-103g5.4 n=1 Tax=Cheilinus undulatus TaxID=241271 RepID=UPI001BD4D7B8|nr:uncharacterized protein si:dkey-103g5.4 [Cheilinus undulatus]